MPRPVTGSYYKTKNGKHGVRWSEAGKRPCKEGFRTKTQAREWFDENVKPRLKRGAPSAEMPFGEFCDLFLERHDGSERTKATLKQRLQPARERFGSWSLREIEGASDDISRWRSQMKTDSAKYRHHRALRECLAAAVRWKYIASNPAVEAGKNPAPKMEELHPFSREEIARIADELGPRDRAIVILAFETGLRTNEWVALHRSDIDWRGRAVAVQRRFADGVLTPYPKTERARRPVPLTARALEALEALPPRLDTPVLFPNRWGGYLNLNNWATRVWAPALEAAGVERRGSYHLRHSYATEALRAGVSVFDLSRMMGTSIQMIQSRYGHLAADSLDHVRQLLEARG